MSCKYELIPLSFSSVVPSVSPSCSLFFVLEAFFLGLARFWRPCPARSARPSVSVNSLFPNTRAPPFLFVGFFDGFPGPFVESKLPRFRLLDFADSFREQTVNQTSSVNVRTRESSCNKNFCWTCWRLLFFFFFKIKKIWICFKGVLVDCFWFN